MINFVHFSYVPNTAKTNRLIAYLRNIPTGINVRVFFIVPDPDNSRIDDLPQNVEVVYCWDRFIFKSKLFRYFEFHRALRYIKSTLHEGDSVYCYNAPLFMLELKKKGVKYYAEKTEHPEVTTLESRLIKYNLKEHLELCRNLDGLFVISTALKDFYTSNGVEGRKINIINMIVDTERFNNIKKSPCTEKYIAYCGNVSNSKDGVDKLIKSFAIVSKQHPEYKLYIIGNVPYPIEGNENYQLAKELRILDKVLFTGIVPQEDMPQILTDSCILALARPDSLQAQCGFPTKLGEYLMTGNPVVVTKVGDIPRFLKDEYSALLASFDNDEEFASKLLWAIENPQKALEIGKCGTVIAMQHFNAKIETSKLFDVICHA